VGAHGYFEQYSALALSQSGSHEYPHFLTGPTTQQATAVDLTSMRLTTFPELAKDETLANNTDANNNFFIMIKFYMFNIVKLNQLQTTILRFFRINS